VAKENQMKTNGPITYDSGRVADGLVFRTHYDRCRHLGTESWRKKKWLKDNEGAWRSVTEDDLAEASNQPSVDGPVKPAAQPSLQTSATNAQNDPQNAGADSRETAANAPSPLHLTASHTQQSVAAPTRTEAGDEVMLGSERYVSIDRTISILRTSRRDFSRRRKGGLALPKIKLGNKAYFKLDAILALAASGEFQRTRRPAA
jgi:hypothetical protein